MPAPQKEIQSKPPVRMPRRKAPPFETWSVVAFSLGTGALIFMAVLNLLSSTGAEAVVKAGIIAACGMLVSYGINRFAIKKGTELAATGFTLAGVVSVFSILAVGGGLFPSTYAGLTINDVNELRIQEYISNLAEFIGARNRQAQKSARLLPLVRVNEEEFRQYRDCEQAESCLSGISQGGRGSVTRLLEEKTRRAGAIAGQLEKGESARKGSLKRLNELLARFQSMSDDTDKSVSEKRSGLVAIDAKLSQEITALDEALPASLLQSYAEELQEGTYLSGHPLATERLNALLKKHAAALSSVLSTFKDDQPVKPSFPSPAGVSETFVYMAHFLPIAALAACIELIFPLTLWVYVLLELIWRKYQEAPDSDKDDSPKTYGPARGRPSRTVARHRQSDSRKPGYRRTSHV